MHKRRTSPQRPQKITLSGKNKNTLTPLSVAGFAENDINTLNKSAVSFIIHNLQNQPEEVLVEVWNRGILVFSDNQAVCLPANDRYCWSWDGYGNDDILDTKVLKSPDLLMRLRVRHNESSVVYDYPLNNSAAKVRWLDVRIDRSAYVVDVTLRPSFSYGGVSGQCAAVIPKSYAELEQLAKEGIERFWSRDGRLAQGIGESIITREGEFNVRITADINAEPKMANFKLIDRISARFGRSTSLVLLRRVYHNSGFYSHKLADSGQSANKATVLTSQKFQLTAAHEVGHLILDSFTRFTFRRDYSWSHKGTSTQYTQVALKNTPMPRTGEIDLMKYSDNPVSMQQQWLHTVASAEDVKGLIGLAGVVFSLKG